MTAGTRLRQAWDDASGASSRWGRTVVLSAVVGKTAMALAGLVIFALVGEEAIEGFSGAIDVVDWEVAAVAVLIAPLMESLFVLALVWALAGRMNWTPLQTAAAIGVLAVPFHGLAPAAFSVLPFFALMGLIQTRWRARGRAWAGFWILCASHALANGATLLLALALPRS